ncbi:hypothetical protein ACPRNU_14080 [Chromobacterium vaccinii]|uniref:hypothetical protein n=1 Tax=Chromobacterium vaccinii TaxID=1108595 RepID=UPI003C752C77
MSSTAHIQHVYEQKGVEAAHDEAFNTVHRQAAEVEAWWNSRFFERRILDDGSKKLWPTTERQISGAYDMADCNDGPIPEFLYCDVDGVLYPVTIGKSDRINADEEFPFVYAASDMVANGKVVGHVMYTDH